MMFNSTPDNLTTPPLTPPAAPVDGPPLDPPTAVTSPEGTISAPEPAPGPDPLSLSSEPAPPPGLPPEPVDLGEPFSVGETSIFFEPGELTPPAKIKLKEFAQQLSNDQATLSSSYHRKLDELSHKEKALTDLATISDQQMALYGRASALQEAMQGIKQTLTNELWASEPDRARQLSDTYQQLQFQLSQTSEAYGAAERERSVKIETERARLRKTGEDQLNRKYPGFSQRVVPELVNYAVAQGVRKEDAQDYAMDPIAAEVMYKAMQFDKLNKTVKPTGGQRKQPVAVASPAQKKPSSLQEMTDNEFAKYLAGQ